MKVAWLCASECWVCDSKHEINWRRSFCTAIPLLSHKNNKFYDVCWETWAIFYYQPSPIWSHLNISQIHTSSWAFWLFSCCETSVLVSWAPQREIFEESKQTRHTLCRLRSQLLAQMRSSCCQRVLQILKLTNKLQNFWCCRKTGGVKLRSFYVVSICNLNVIWPKI